MMFFSILSWLSHTRGAGPRIFAIEIMITLVKTLLPSNKIILHLISLICHYFKIKGLVIAFILHRSFVFAMIAFYLIEYHAVT